MILCLGNTWNSLYIMSELVYNSIFFDVKEIQEIGGMSELEYNSIYIDSMFRKYME